MTRYFRPVPEYAKAKNKTSGKPNLPKLSGNVKVPKTPKKKTREKSTNDISNATLNHFRSMLDHG